MEHITSNSADKSWLNSLENKNYSSKSDQVEKLGEQLKKIQESLTP